MYSTKFLVVTILTILLALSTLFLSPAYGLNVIDQKQEIFYGLSPTLTVGFLLGQVIRPAISPYVGVEVLIGPTHSENTFTLKLREGLPGPSLGAILVEVTKTDPSNPVAGGHWVRFDFPSPVAVTTGSTYWIQLNNTGTDTGVQWFGSHDDPYLDEDPYWAIVQNLVTKQIMAYYNDDFAFRTYAEVSDPSFIVEQNGSPVSSIEVPVCSEFTLDFWIRDIPDGYGMVAFDFDVYYDPDLMELVDNEVFFPTGHNWDSAGASYDVGLYSPHGNWGGPGGEATPETDDFLAARATFHCTGEGLGSEIRVSAGQLTLTFRNLETGEETEVFPSDYVVVCNQYQQRQQTKPYPVGGVLFTADKLAILAPYLSLIGIIAISLSVYISRKRYRA